ncbi:YggS family pyridoxal phosphate enzyme [Actinomycetaceae bacterium L2_0104]
MTEIPGVAEIADRFKRLRERVSAAESASGRTPGSVQVELAAKYQAPERVLAALNGGATLLGHNIVQQLEASEVALAEARAPTHRTHVIGHVQKNKAAKALRYSQCIETVDSYKLAERLNRLHAERIAGEQPLGAVAGVAPEGIVLDADKPTGLSNNMLGQATGPFDIMIQVNSSGADSQYGRDPEAVMDLAGRIGELPYLRIVGLMTIGTHTDDVAEIARSFQVVRELREKLISAGVTSATELSMGMTHDMEIAIAEGSTIIRVGTAVFGPRPRV